MVCDGVRRVVHALIGRVTGRSVPSVLPPSPRVRLGLIAALAALVVVALGVLYADDSKPGMVDARIWAAVEGVAPPWRQVALATDFLGEPVGAATLLKSLVGRTIHDGSLSYPSGHTAFLTALALVVALPATGRLGLSRTAGTLLVLAAALVAGGAMGWAQVALGAHYPTDVLGGWCTALAVIPATAWLVDRMADRLADRMADAGRRERR